MEKSNKQICLVHFEPWRVSGRENCTLSIPFPQQIYIPLHTSRPYILSPVSLWWSSEGQPADTDITAAQCIVGGEYRHGIREERHGELAVCRWRGARIWFTNSHVHSEYILGVFSTGKKSALSISQSNLGLVQKFCSILVWLTFFQHKHAFICTSFI